MVKKKDVKIPKESATELLNRLLKENNLILTQTSLQQSINFVSNGAGIIDQPSFEAKYGR